VQVDHMPWALRLVIAADEALTKLDLAQGEYLRKHETVRRAGQDRSVRSNLTSTNRTARDFRS
jgi:hypothetical protein